MSARRLHDEELIRSLRELSIEPGTMSFELVESIFLDENDELVTWNVEQIKALGHRHRDRRFRHRLRIDRQPAQAETAPAEDRPAAGDARFSNSPAQRHLVGSIIDIGKSLGIEVLAEGVETMDHAKALKSLGCNALQGHAFAQAMSAADFKAFALARKLRAAS